MENLKLLQKPQEYLYGGVLSSKVTESHACNLQFNQWRTPSLVSSREFPEIF